MNNFDPTALCDRCGKTCRRKLSLRKSGQRWCVVCCMVRAAHKRRKKRHAKMLETGLKKCIRCDETKPLDQYPKARQKRNGEPRYAYCKTCHSAYQRTQKLRNFFNLTDTDYDTILEHQGGKCALCEREPSRLRLAVDHNHKTGQIRGLLCMWCNRAIGFYRDDWSRIKRTVRYFKNPPATVALGEDRFGLKGRSTNKAATVRHRNKIKKVRRKYKKRKTAK